MRTRELFDQRSSGDEFGFDVVAVPRSICNFLVQRLNRIITRLQLNFEFQDVVFTPSQEL